MYNKHNRGNVGQVIRPWMPPLVYNVIKEYSVYSLEVTLNCKCKVSEIYLEYNSTYGYHYCINSFKVNVIEDRDTGDESDR